MPIDQADYSFEPDPDAQTDFRGGCFRIEAWGWPVGLPLSAHLLSIARAMTIEFKVGHGSEAYQWRVNFLLN